VQSQLGRLSGLRDSHDAAHSHCLPHRDPDRFAHGNRLAHIDCDTDGYADTDASAHFHPRSRGSIPASDRG